MSIFTFPRLIKCPSSTFISELCIFERWCWFTVSVLFIPRENGYIESSKCALKWWTNVVLCLVAMLHPQERERKKDAVQLYKVLSDSHLDFKQHFVIIINNFVCFNERKNGRKKCAPFRSAWTFIELLEWTSVIYMMFIYVVLKLFLLFLSALFHTVRVLFQPITYTHTILMHRWNTI